MDPQIFLLILKQNLNSKDFAGIWSCSSHAGVFLMSTYCPAASLLLQEVFTPSLAQKCQISMHILTFGGAAQFIF